MLGMADPNLSPDLAEGSPPREVAALGSKGSKAKAKSKVPRAFWAHSKSCAKEKDAFRRHKALERQCTKATSLSAAEPASPPTSCPMASPQSVFGDLPHHLPPESLGWFLALVKLVRSWTSLWPLGPLLTCLQSLIRRGRSFQHHQCLCIHLLLLLLCLLALSMLKIL